MVACSMNVIGYTKNTVHDNVIYKRYRKIEKLARGGSPLEKLARGGSPLERLTALGRNLRLLLRRLYFALRQKTPDGVGNAKLRFAFWGYVLPFGQLLTECRKGFTPAPYKGALLAQCNVNIALGHRADEHMSALISPLKDIINVFLRVARPLTPCRQR